MRIAVLSDIHSNLEALDAVLARAASEDAEAFWVLGDIVGYGADPDAVVSRLRALPAATLLAGNHDLAATERFDVTWFNDVAAEAIRWTSDIMSDDLLATLMELSPRADTDRAVLVHGSLRDPAGEYVRRAEHAAASFAAENFSICFFGHTHRPTMFTYSDARARGSVLHDGKTVRIEGRAMLNPGSVGQPRDADPRASFGIFDTEAGTFTVRREPYDIAGAQKKIRAAGLPNVLADRLEVGR